MEVNQYTGDTALHIGGHSTEYIDIVTERLEKVVENGGGKDSIIEVLNQIRKDLLEGKLKINKR